MTCEQFNELWQRLDVMVPVAELDLLASGRVTASELVAFARHVRGCGACQRKVLDRYVTSLTSATPETRQVMSAAADKIAARLREKLQHDRELFELSTNPQDGGCSHDERLDRRPRRGDVAD